MKTALAMVFTGVGRPLEMREYPVPVPARDELVVKVGMSTICGSDLHTVGGRRACETPMILGHEITGRVLLAGADVTADALGQPLREGDRVTWSIAASCGQCVACRDWKLPQKCLHLFKYGHAASLGPPYFNGGFAEVVYLRRGTTVLKIPDELSDREVTPINCALATVMHGVEKMELTGGDRVLIQGAGMLGIYAAAVLSERGCASVLIADVDPVRLAVAARFGGAGILLDGATPEERKQQLREQIPAASLDAVLEVSGNPESVSLGLACLRPGGRYVTAGLVYPGAGLELDGRELVISMLTLRGIHNYRPEHLIQSLELIRTHAGNYPFAELITAEFPLRELNRAMEAARDRRNIRVAIC